MNLYEQLRVPAEGHYVHESAMADTLYHLLPQVRPDIVVITGHDGVLKSRQPYDLYSLSSYKNSQNFVSAIQVARQYERHLDALTIVAGACQSHFEALLRAGANFASSPGRILIHALDPVYVASKAAFTSVRETVNMNDILHNTISGSQELAGWKPEAATASVCRGSTIYLRSKSIHRLCKGGQRKSQTGAFLLQKIH